MVFESRLGQSVSREGIPLEIIFQFREQEIGTNYVVEVDPEVDLDLDTEYEEHEAEIYGKFVL